jgi:hypothetical protein
MKVINRNLEVRINEKLDKLKSRKGYKFFILNLNYPLQNRLADTASIAVEIARIEKVLPQIKILIKRIRMYFDKIWHQNKFSASYLLICKAYGNIYTLLLLAKSGANHELVEICRSAIESLDLVILFLDKDKDKFLGEWFKGKIISNEEARINVHELINKGKAKDVPVKDVKGDIYNTYSSFTHSSYSALLDSIDVFYEDYDFKKNAGFHHANRNMVLIDNVIISLLLTMKNFFLHVGDKEGYDISDKIMKDSGYIDIPQEEIDAIFEKYNVKE